jgi:hypothetical protein
MTDKEKEILKWSDPVKVIKNAKEYFNRDIDIYLSTKDNKKYMLKNPDTNKWVHFGQMYYEDYTKHQDDKRRNNYLNRSGKIKGDWKDNPYSPNNLSRYLLW